MASSIWNEITQTSSTDLPGLLCEIIPIIVLLEELLKILSDVKKDMKLVEKGKKDAKSYMDSNPDALTTGYKKLKGYEGYERCENLTKLYYECKHCEPVYIPW